MSIAQGPEEVGRDEDSQVIEWLKPVFPQLTPRILRASVLHPSNRQGQYDKARLLQRCIDDLLELRTYRMSTDNGSVNEDMAIGSWLEGEVFHEQEEDLSIVEENTNRGTDSQPISIVSEDDLRVLSPIAEIDYQADVQIVEPKTTEQLSQQQVNEVCELFPDIQRNYVEKYLQSCKSPNPVDAMVEFLFDRKGLYPKIKPAEALDSPVQTRLSKKACIGSFEFDDPASPLSATGEIDLKSRTDFILSDDQDVFRKLYHNKTVDDHSSQENVKSEAAFSDISRPSVRKVNMESKHTFEYASDNSSDSDEFPYDALRVVTPTKMFPVIAKSASTGSLANKTNIAGLRETELGTKNDTRENEVVKTINSFEPNNTVNKSVPPNIADAQKNSLGEIRVSPVVTKQRLINSESLGRISPNYEQKKNRRNSFSEKNSPIGTIDDRSKVANDKNKSTSFVAKSSDSSNVVKQSKASTSTTAVVVKKSKRKREDKEREMPTKFVNILPKPVENKTKSVASTAISSKGTTSLTSSLSTNTPVSIPSSNIVEKATIPSVKTIHSATSVSIKTPAKMEEKATKVVSIHTPETLAPVKTKKVITANLPSGNNTSTSASASGIKNPATAAVSAGNIPASLPQAYGTERAAAIASSGITSGSLPPANTATVSVGNIPLTVSTTTSINKTATSTVSSTGHASAGLPAININQAGTALVGKKVPPILPQAKINKPASTAVSSGNVPSSISQTANTVSVKNADQVLMTATNNIPVIGANVTAANNIPVIGANVTAANNIPVIGANVTAANNIPVIGANVTAANNIPVIGANVTALNNTPVIGANVTIPKFAASNIPKAPATITAATPMIVDQAEFSLDDIDIAEQMRIYEAIRKSETDKAIPPAVQQPEPEVPKPQKTPIEILTDEVCSMFPNVDPNYVTGKMNECQCNDQVMCVVNKLLACKSYPKKNSNPNPQNLTEEQSAVGTNQLVEPNNNTKSTVDYYNDYSTPVSSNYFDQCLKLLETEFRKLPMRDLRYIMGKYNNHYAPSRQLIVETLKAAGIKTDEIINQCGVQSPQPGAVGGTATKAAAVIVDFRISGTIYKSKLLKCGRAKRNCAFEKTAELMKEIEFMISTSKVEKEEKDRLVAMTVNETEYQESGQAIECGCCFGEYPFESMVQCYEGHLFCQDCLQGYAKQAVFGGGKATLECMSDGCEATYPKSQLARSLPSNVLDKYEERCQEEAINLADMDGLVRCPHCDFAALMDPGDKVFTCHNSHCLKETCRYCKEDWEEHFGIPCSEIEKKDETKLRLAFEEKMTMAKIRQCHRCKASFTKSDGCNKMTCRCGAKMCYICRKPNIDYAHFCRHVRDPGQPCNTCKACSLWTNPDEDDDRAISEIKKKAQEERKAQGYDDDKDIGAPEQARPPAAKKQKTHHNVPQQPQQLPQHLHHQPQPQWPQHLQP